MSTVLVHGKITRAPERKIGRASQKPFVSLTVREGDGDHVIWWSVLSFSDSTSEDLLTLKVGETVSVTGALKLEPYIDEKSGEARVRQTVFIDAVLSAHRPKKNKNNQATRKASPQSKGIDPFDDTVPF